MGMNTSLVLIEAALLIVLVIVIVKHWNVENTDTDKLQIFVDKLIVSNNNNKDNVFDELGVEQHFFPTDSTENNMPSLDELKDQNRSYPAPKEYPLANTKIAAMKEVCEKQYFPETGNKKETVLQSKKKLCNYDDKNSIFYCFSAKTGTTNWRTMAAAIMRNVTIETVENMVNRKEIKNIYADLPYLDFPDKIQAKFGMLVARHPLLRLYSSWSHRLSNSLSYQKTFFKNQIAIINKKYTRKEDGPIPRNLYTTFPGFLRFVADDIAHDDTKYRDLHWLKISKRCQPCELMDFYSFLGNTETAGDDAKEFLEMVGKGWLGDFPGAYSKGTKRTGKSRGEVEQTTDVEKHIQDVKDYYKENVPRVLIESI